MPTPSLSSFGIHTTYNVPPESTGGSMLHNALYYVKVTGLTGPFVTPATIVGATSGFNGWISDYRVLDDGHRLTMSLNELSTDAFMVDEVLTISYDGVTVTAIFKAAQRVLISAISLINPNQPEHGLGIDNRGSANVRFAEGQPILSGFGQLKTVAQRVLGVYESSAASYDELFSVNITNGATNAYEPVTSSYIITATTANGSECVKTTNRYHYYLPGSSNYVLMTVSCGDQGKPNNIRQWGAFDDNDGVFFELNGTTVNAVVRSSTSGSIVDTAIPRSSWNLDKLDGTGASKIVLDVTKTQIWWVDYQWLGAGRIRFGIVEPTGGRLVCHEVYNAGLNFVAYMRSGTLPLRLRNVNTGATGASSELRVTCMAIYMEGTYEDYTFWRSADMVATAVSVASTDVHILSMKSKATVNGISHNPVVAYPETLNVFTTQPVAITLWQSAELTGSPSWAVTSDSSIDGTVDGTLSLTNARKFKEIFLNAGATSIDMTPFFEVNDEGISLNADGTPTLWTITASKLTATTAVVTVNLGYRELW